MKINMRKKATLMTTITSKIMRFIVFQNHLLFIIFTAMAKCGKLCVRVCVCRTLCELCVNAYNVHFKQMSHFCWALAHTHTHITSWA